MTSPRRSDELTVHVGPTSPEEILGAIRRSGARLGSLEEADAVVWMTSSTKGFPRSLPSRVSWIQLPAAGIEEWFRDDIIDPSREWTSATGAYSLNVAEHALALLLVGVRSIGPCIAEPGWRRAEMFERATTLNGARVAIIGAGGIGATLIPAFTALGCHSLAVTRRGLPVPGAEQTFPADGLHAALAAADHAVVAAPATAATRHLIGRRELGLLKPTSWIVNVARGSLIDSEALCAALRAGTLGGAALDVTDPEPLPPDHPLWQAPNVIITPHIANTPQALIRDFAERVEVNLRRRLKNQPLLGRVDTEAGY
ncbi:MAG TPA: NAD(P)-dependent oxidoreductase [Jatrophihabitans sp.]